MPVVFLLERNQSYLLTVAHHDISVIDDRRAQRYSQSHQLMSSQSTQKTMTAIEGIQAEKRTLRFMIPNLRGVTSDYLIGDVIIEY